MSYKIYLKKAKILLKEAEIDLKNACYNKVVSALWFSMELLMRGLLLKRRKIPPEKAGKLIHVFVNECFLSDKTKAEVASLLTSLYSRRKDVDHKKKIADENFAYITYEIYQKVLLKIKQELGEEII